MYRNRYDCEPQSKTKSHRPTETAQYDDDDVDDGGPSVDQQSLRTLLSDIGPSLEPMSPEEGVESYLRHRTDITQNTKIEYLRKLEYFLEYAEITGIENLNTLSGREITEYRTWRREDSTDEVETLSPKTMRDDLFLLRDFIRYLESIEAVKDGLSRYVNIPDLDDGTRDITLKPERLRQILDYLDQYEYATLEHVTISLFSSTGRRLGAIIGLDMDDYYPDDSDPYLEFNHRAGETPLKNGETSEGSVSLPPSVNEILSDYIEIHRHDVTDDYGREPLLTTPHGRPAKSTLRRYVYKFTRPCHIGQPCPHDKSPDTCEASQDTDLASNCESTRSPHALRHGYLTELLREGVPTEVIQGRCDVSEQVLNKHYDERSESEKRQARKEILDEVRQNGGAYL